MPWLYPESGDAAPGHAEPELALEPGAPDAEPDAGEAAGLGEGEGEVDGDTVGDGVGEGDARGDGETGSVDAGDGDAAGDGETAGLVPAPPLPETFPIDGGHVMFPGVCPPGTAELAPPDLDGPLGTRVPWPFSDPGRPVPEWLPLRVTFR